MHSDQRDRGPQKTDSPFFPAASAAASSVPAAATLPVAPLPPPPPPPPHPLAAPAECCSVAAAVPAVTGKPPSSAAVVPAADAAPCVLKATWPHVGWRTAFVLSCTRGPRAAVTWLPTDLCKVVVAYCAEGWQAEHCGLRCDAHDGLSVVMKTRAAYPAIWSRGTVAGDQGVISFDVSVKQVSLARGQAMDDRYMMGFVNKGLFVADDYPGEVLGRMIAFEFCGRIVFDEENSEEVCDLKLYNEAAVEMRVCRASRTVEVFVDGMYRGGAKVCARAGRGPSGVGGGENACAHTHTPTPPPAPTMHHSSPSTWSCSGKPFTPLSSSAPTVTQPWPAKASRPSTAATSKPTSQPPPPLRRPASATFVEARPPHTGGSSSSSTRPSSHVS